MYVNLTDDAWRDANLETLHHWHPCFKDFNADRDTLLNCFRSFLERYRDLMLTECSEPQEALLEHIRSELIIHLARSFEAITDELWEVESE